MVGSIAQIYLYDTCASHAFDVFSGLLQYCRFLGIVYDSSVVPRQYRTRLLEVNIIHNEVALAR
jgi:hypothetical protein